MKFILPLTLFTLNIFLCRANDTLTRAQVYNFSVGDTFDYFWDNGPVNPPPGPNNPFKFYSGYYRIIITAVNYSITGDTFFIDEQVVFPLPVQTLTLTLTDLNKYEVYLDSEFYDCNLTYSIDTDTTYNGRTINSIFDSCFEGNDFRKFAEGLSLVDFHSESFGDYPMVPVMVIDTTLIFYSKLGERWGTPYYDLLTGINNLNQQFFVSVYPTVNSGDFQVVTEDDAGKRQLSLCDVFGRQVMVQNIYGGKNAIHVPGVASGIYLWNVTSQSGLVRSGKIIIE